MMMTMYDPGLDSDQLLRTFKYGPRLLLLFSPSSEYSGLISFRIGWFNLLAVQGTLK